MPEVAEAVAVNVFCPLCGEVRYKSKRPIGLKEKLSSSLFDPATDDSPPLSDGQPATCHVCGGGLKFMRAVPQTTAASAPPSRAELLMRQQEVVAHERAVTSDTLFEVRSGEDIKDIREVPGGVVVITSKRIVRVDL